MTHRNRLFLQLAYINIYNHKYNQDIVQGLNTRNNYADRKTTNNQQMRRYTICMFE